MSNMNYYNKQRNAGSQDEVIEQKKRIIAKEKSFRDDLARILATPEGMRVMTHIISWFGVFAPMGLIVSAEIHHRHAIKDVGLRLLHLCKEAKPDCIAEMFMQSDKEGE